MAAFIVVLAVLFMPLADGRNAMDYLDSLYNSISKDSAYHIQEVKEEVAALGGRPVSLKLAMESEELASGAAAIMRRNGAEVEVAGTEIMVECDLTAILTACLDDADDMFRNDDGRVASAYGRNGKLVLFQWWKALKAMDKALKREGSFDDAKIVNAVVDKGLECAYNYYGIEPVEISDKLGVVILSLAFYVFYTVWYGYAIIMIFEGCGLRLSH
jgi:hypothetical protein